MNVARTFARTLTTAVPKRAAAKEVHPSYLNIRSKYKNYQADDGLLVHQKGGTTDQVLFVATVLVNAVGLVLFGDILYRLSFNKK